MSGLAATISCPIMYVLSKNQSIIFPQYPLLSKEVRASISMLITFNRQIWKVIIKVQNLYIWQLATHYGLILVGWHAICLHPLDLGNLYRF